MKQNKIMKAVVRKIGAKEVLDSLYVHSKRCREEVCFILGHGCVQCATKDESKKAIDLIDPYRYCETCDDIKYYIGVVETSGHKELPGCIGCWSKSQSVKEVKAIYRIWERPGKLKEIQRK